MIHRKRPWLSLGELKTKVEDWLSDEILVYFYLKQGDGDWPEVSELSDPEKKNPILMATFVLDWFPDETDENYDFKDFNIEECQFIYDGVQYIDEEWGMRVVGGNLIGIPRPIIRFKFSHTVSVDAFTRAVCLSSIELLPASRRESGREPFYCEYLNGNPSAFDASFEDSLYCEENFQKFIEKKASVYKKIFSFHELRDGIDLKCFL